MTIVSSGPIELDSCCNADSQYGTTELDVYRISIVRSAVKISILVIHELFQQRDRLLPDFPSYTSRVRESVSSWANIIAVSRDDMLVSRGIQKWSRVISDLLKFCYNIVNVRLLHCQLILLNGV